MKMPARPDIERLYDEHAQALFAFLLNLSRDEADTRDVLQEIFVKLAREPKLLDGVREERAFLIRLVHGSFPESLDALAPQFIAKVPHDLIGGEPLKYRRAADGAFMLYSVGWNEKDDGGVALTFGKSSELNKDKGDWV